MSTFAERVKWARTSAKLSQAKLGAAVGVSQSVISDIENGVQLETTLNVHIAVACSVDPVWLVLGRGEPKPVNLEIAKIWNELDNERKGRLLGTAYDILVGQRGVAVKPSGEQPWPGVPMPQPPTVKGKRQKL